MVSRLSFDRFCRGVCRTRLLRLDNRLSLWLSHLDETLFHRLGAYFRDLHLLLNRRWRFDLLLRRWDHLRDVRYSFRT